MRFLPEKQRIWHFVQNAQKNRVGTLCGPDGDIWEFGPLRSELGSVLCPCGHEFFLFYFLFIKILCYLCIPFSKAL
jgi:hypothetical protein